MLLLLGRQEGQLRAVPDLVLELLSKTLVCVKTSFGFTGPQTQMITSPKADSGALWGQRPSRHP